MDERNEKLVRRQKLEQWRAQESTFPNDWSRTHFVEELQASFSESTQEQLADEAHTTAVAGRVVLRRVMGKASFVTLRDVSGDIQCYFRVGSLGSQSYETFKSLCDLGDIIGVKGTMMRTNKGELTVHAGEFRLLNKSVQPFPSKYQGLEDQELKYRRRYVDLMVNESSREIFKVRSATTNFLRNFFNQRGYLEVETPMMHPIPGGAVAKPFVTHHNALDRELFLRIAPELYLKRLVVGGLERVYEINRNFRNEGLSTRHNPEFTMLEFYQAYATYEDLIQLTATLMFELTQEVCGSHTLQWGEHELEFESTPNSMTMTESVAKALSLDSDSKVMDFSYLQTVAKQREINLSDSVTWGTLLNDIFEKLVEKSLNQPCFITEYPVEVSPLARRNDQNPKVTDRFEYFVGGREIANGFSELNDPADQEQRFREQVARLERGDDEAMHFDQDYITALEYGLPPTAGEGLGVDRLVMLLTNSATIRDVLLFPQLKPEQS